jgi:hypothetical protein
VTNGVFDSLTHFDGQLLHSRGIGVFNGVDFSQGRAKARLVAFLLSL